jgi:hypothetical protein
LANRNNLPPCLTGATRFSRKTPKTALLGPRRALRSLGHLEIDSKEARMPAPSRRTLGRSALTALCAIALLAAEATEARGADKGWAWPVHGRVITPYANDNSKPYAGGMHRGIDIAAPAGTPVRAARGGEVAYAGALGSSGLTVAIRTADGYATSYLHLAAISVARGDRVGPGDRVGAVGTTGRRSASEPHLHFGVRLARRDHYYVDPLSLLPPLPARGVEAVPAPVAARAPARAEPAPAALPIRARVRARTSVRGPAAVPAGSPAGAPREASEPVRHPAARPAPVGPPRPGRDWGPALGIAGLALVFCALFGRGLVRALRDANGALGERLGERVTAALSAIGHASARTASKLALRRGY